MIRAAATYYVMSGLVPGIHEYGTEDVDGRVKPGHGGPIFGAAP
jgi:hypothetical protein